MLKKTVTYTDYNEEQVTETLYFNLTKPELLELSVEGEGGLGRYLERIIETEDLQQLIAEFKRIVLLAYGKKSDDGRRFIKNDELKEEFSQTAAFVEVFMELATDDKAAVAFLAGVMPKDLSASVEQAALEEATKPTTDTPSV